MGEDLKFDSSKSLLEIREHLDNKKYTYQFVPKRFVESVDIDNKFILDSNGKRLKVAYMVDILHSLIMKYHYLKNNRTNLSSLILKEKYGSGYNYYMNWLVDNSYISMVSDYFVGKKAKTYSINLDDVKNLTRYKNYDRILLKKYKKAVLSIEVDKKNFNWIDDEVRIKLVYDLYYVDIDYNKASLILEDIGDKLSYEKNKYSVECVRDKHIFYHFDNFGRCHTNFTVLKSNIRKDCLTIDGEEIEEIDINNSQPLFLAILININNDIKVDLEEYMLFKELVINGKFYKYYEDRCDIKGKKKVKKSVYKVLFGKNFEDSDNLAFKSIFPSIFSFIIKYKEKNNDYKSLAYDLQRSESNLLFNNIVKELILISPDIKLFTVHDSIAYPKKYKKIVNEVFNKKMTELFV